MRPTFIPTILTEGVLSVLRQPKEILQWFLTSFVNAKLSLFRVKKVQCPVSKALSDINLLS